MPNMSFYAKVSSHKYVENHVSYKKESHDVIVVGSGILVYLLQLKLKKQAWLVVPVTILPVAGVIQGSRDEYQKKFTKYQNDTPELHAKN